MITEWIKMPGRIINHVRKGLQRPVKIALPRAEIKQIRTKNLREIFPVFNERVFYNQRLVIPDKIIPEAIKIDYHRNYQDNAG